MLSRSLFILVSSYHHHSFRISGLEAINKKANVVIGHNLKNWYVLMGNNKILGCRDPRYKHEYLDKRDNTVESG